MLALAESKNVEAARLQRPLCETEADSGHVNAVSCLPGWQAIV